MISATEPSKMFPVLAVLVLCHLWPVGSQDSLEALLRHTTALASMGNRRYYEAQPDLPDQRSILNHT